MIWLHPNGFWLPVPRTSGNPERFLSGGDPGVKSFHMTPQPPFYMAWRPGATRTLLKFNRDTYYVTLPSCLNLTLLFWLRTDMICNFEAPFNEMKLYHAFNSIRDLSDKKCNYSLVPFITYHDFNSIRDLSDKKCHVLYLILCLLKSSCHAFNKPYMIIRQTHLNKG